MYSIFLEHTQKAFKPFEDIWLAQTKVLDDLMHQQTAWANDLWVKSLGAMASQATQGNLLDVFKNQQDQLEQWNQTFVDLFKPTQASGAAVKPLEPGIEAKGFNSEAIKSKASLDAAALDAAIKPQKAAAEMSVSRPESKSSSDTKLSPPEPAALAKRPAKSLKPSKK